MHAQWPSMNAGCGFVLPVRRLAARVQVRDEVRDPHVAPDVGEQPGVALGIIPNVRAIQGTAAVTALKPAKVTVFRPETRRAPKNHALRGHRVDELLGQVRLVERRTVELRSLPEGVEILGQVAGHGRSVGPTTAVEIARVAEPLHVGKMPSDGESHALRLAAGDRVKGTPIAALNVSPGLL